MTDDLSILSKISRVVIKGHGKAAGEAPPTHYGIAAQYIAGASYNGKNRGAEGRGGERHVCQRTIATRWGTDGNVVLYEV